MQRKVCISLLLIILLFTGCGTQEKWHTATFLFFDTLCEVRIFSSRALFRVSQDDIHRIFSEIDRVFSPGTNDISSPLAKGLFARAAEIHRESNGCFDITVGALTRLWGFLNGNPGVPKKNILQEALLSVGMEKIKREQGSLLLPRGMELDWGGIAKGFGIDLASRALQERGISRGFINAGGDLFCWGKNPDEKSWRIGIQHPRKEGLFGIIQISGVGAATAGDYQKFFIEGSIRYHHIFDPQTGFPARGKQSVTVVGPETLVCDALSTAIFVCSRPSDLLAHYPEYGAIIMDSEGIVTAIGKAYSFHSLQE
ncbi:MAG: FAD:protein FMN transferase [Candidatus Aminicenantes bacterium]|jgi:thiamine biosynthesis lipoprotein